MPITAKTQKEIVEGYIVPIASGTRVRFEPSTYSSVKIQSVAAGTKVVVSETIEYLENDPTLTHVVKGDKWGKVVSIAGLPIPEPAYMAIYYHGQGPICREEFTAGTPIPDPDPEPEPTIVYPDLILVGPAGAQREYVPKDPQ